MHNSKGEKESSKKMVNKIQFLLSQRDSFVFVYIYFSYPFVFFNLLQPSNSNKKISNKKQGRIEISADTSNEKPFISRLLNIGWRHKINYEGKF